MRVRVLPSALFENGSVAQMDQERLSTKQEVVGSSPTGVTRFVGLNGYDSGLVNRRRWFESSTKLWRGSGFGVQGSEFRVQSSGFRVQGSEFRVQPLGCCPRAS
jgi:hypothetical protein